MRVLIVQVLVHCIWAERRSIALNAAARPFEFGDACGSLGYASTYGCIFDDGCCCNGVQEQSTGTWVPSSVSATCETMGMFPVDNCGCESGATEDVCEDYHIASVLNSGNCLFDSVARSILARQVQGWPGSQSSQAIFNADLADPSVRALAQRFRMSVADATAKDAGRLKEVWDWMVGVHSPQSCRDVLKSAGLDQVYDRTKFAQWFAATWGRPEYDAKGAITSKPAFAFYADTLQIRMLAELLKTRIVILKNNCKEDREYGSEQGGYPIFVRQDGMHFEAAAMKFLQINTFGLQAGATNVLRFGDVPVVHGAVKEVIYKGVTYTDMLCKLVVPGSSLRTDGSKKVQCKCEKGFRLKGSNAQTIETCTAAVKKHPPWRKRKFDPANFESKGCHCLPK